MIGKSEVDERRLLSFGVGFWMELSKLERTRVLMRKDRLLMSFVVVVVGEGGGWGGGVGVGQRAG